MGLIARIFWVSWYIWPFLQLLFLRIIALSSESFPLRLFIEWKLDMFFHILRHRVSVRKIRTKTRIRISSSICRHSMRISFLSVRREAFEELLWNFRVLGTRRSWRRTFRPSRAQMHVSSFRSYLKLLNYRWRTIIHRYVAVEVVVVEIPCAWVVQLLYDV